MARSNNGRLRASTMNQSPWNERPTREGSSANGTHSSLSSEWSRPGCCCLIHTSSYAPRLCSGQCITTAIFRQGLAIRLLPPAVGGQETFMGSSTEATLFASPDVVAEPAGDGCLLLRSAEPLGEHPLTVIHSLRAWASRAPGHPLVAERATNGSWRTSTYGEAVAAAESIGQALVDMGMGPDRPLLILSGNGVDHLLMTLAAMTAGIPVAPVSAAYSLQSRDHARIRAVTELIKPGAV